MKRASKILISMLLLVSMLAGYVPAFISTQTASAAAGETTYQYVKVNTPTVGKTYIIANSGSSGTFYALSPGSNPSEGSSVASVQVTGDGSKITGASGDLESLEWTVLPGRPAGSNASKVVPTYMLYNERYGYYLWNPVYEEGNNTSMKLTANPLADEHSNYTRQIFRANTNAASAYVGVPNNVTSTLSTDRLLVTANNTSDPHQYFNCGGINAGTYNGVIWTFHIADSASYSGWEYFLFPTGKSHIERNYLNTSFRGWASLSEEHTATGTLDANGIRMDIPSNTSLQFKLASIIFTKNIYARVAISDNQHRYNQYSLSGFYPSHRYIFCQYAFGNAGNGANVIASSGSTEGVQQYYYGWYNNSFIRNWNGNQTNANINNTTSGLSYFYEKQVSSKANSTFKLVEDNYFDASEGYFMTVGDSSVSSSNLVISFDMMFKETTLNQYGNLNTAKQLSTYGNTPVVIYASDTTYAPKVGVGETVANYTGPEWKLNVWYKFKFDSSSGNKTVIYCNDKIVATVNTALSLLEGKFIYGHATDVAIDNIRVSNGNNVNYFEDFSDIDFSDNSGEIYSNSNFYLSRSFPTSTRPFIASCVRLPEVHSLNEDFMIIGDTSGTTKCMIASSATTVTTTDCTISDDGVYSGEPSDNMLWHLSCVGGQYYITNKQYGTNLYLPGTDASALGLSAQGTTGGSSVSPLAHYTWTYDCENHRLIAYDLIDAEGETLNPINVGIRSAGTFNSTATAYIYKRTFCPHESTSTDEKAATCTEDGYKRVTCDDCGAVLEEEVYTQLGHSYNSSVTNPTCTTAGYTTYTCSRCGYSYTGDNVAALGHDFSVPLAGAVEPTCTTAGHGTFKCSRCDVTETKNYEPLGHDYITNVTDPTCTTGGYTTTTCSRCDYNEVSDHVPALGHTPGDWVAINNNTQMERRCTVCNTLIEIRDISSSTTVTVGNTVTLPGDFTGVEVPVDLVGNEGIINEGIWSLGYYIVYDKSLSLTGVVPGDIFTEIENSPYNVDPLTNTKAYNTLKAAGYTDNQLGNLACYFFYAEGIGDSNVIGDGNLCTLVFDIPSVNWKFLYPIKTVAVAGYTINENLEDVELTTVDGSITVYVECTGDSHSYGTEIVEPTCTEVGYTIYTCVGCGHKYTDDEVPALGHEYESVTVDATCTTGGYTKHTCIRCGDTYTDNVTPSGHQYNNGTVKDVTGTHGIIVRYSCTICGHWYDEESGTATGTGTSTGGSDSDVLYQFKYTVTPGNEYILSSRYTNGKGYAIADTENGLRSEPISISRRESGNQEQFVVETMVSPMKITDNSIWLATEGNMFVNKVTGKYLYANADGVGTSASPFDGNINDYVFSKVGGSGHMSASGYYLDLDKSKLNILEAYPGENCYRPQSWDTMVADLGGSELWVLNNFTLEFDMAFESSNSCIRIVEGKEAYYSEVGFEITPSNVMICQGDGGGNKYSAKATGSYSYGSATYNYKHWNHYKFVVNGSTATAYVNGVQVAQATGLNVTNSEARGFMFINPGYSYGLSEYSSSTTQVSIDNVFATTDYKSPNQQSYNTAYMIDCDNDTGGYTSVWSSTDGRIYRVSDDATVTESNETYTNSGFVTTTTLNENENEKIYFFNRYDKTAGENSTIYRLASELKSGKDYVLVNANAAGNAATVGGKATTVFCDGISWIPYIVNVESGDISTVAKTPNGLMVSGGGGFYKADGTVGGVAEAELFDDLGSIKIVINGVSYYLYEQYTVRTIDTAIQSDVAVVDFGYGFTLDADSMRENDMWFTESKIDMSITNISTALDGASAGTEFYITSKASGTKGTITADGATATFADGAITFDSTPSFAETFTFKAEYKITNLGDYIYGNVTVLPATVVYYEDNSPLITYNGTWTTETSTSVSDVIASAEDTYGNSTAYGSFATFSGNSIQKATVTAQMVEENLNAENMNWMPSATFTFTGDGFEVFSAVGQTTGLIFVEVRNDEGAYVYGSIVDNYFGYSYSDNKWSPTATGQDANTAPQLYQVPVIRKLGMTYDTYTVKISVSYEALFDVAGLGYSEFYIDGVRIYNPLGADNNDANSAYAADGELAPQFISMKSCIDSSDENNAFFIDGTTIDRDNSAVIDYNEVGAKNEVSIPSEKGVAFKLTKTGDATPAKVTIGAKLIKGTEGTLTVTCGNKSRTITINSATDMYYDITNLITWTDNTTPSIVITNSSTDAIISLTTAKISYSSANAATVTMFSDESVSDDAWMTMAYLYGVEDGIQGDINGDGRVTAMDLLKLKKIISGTTGSTVQEEYFSDVNGDGRINTRDLAIHKGILSGN